MSKIDYQRLYSNRRRPSMESSSHSSNSPSLFSSGGSSAGSSSNHTTPQESPLHPNLALYGAYPGMAMMSSNNSAKEYQMMLLNNMNGAPPNHHPSRTLSGSNSSKRPNYPPLSGSHNQIPIPRSAPSPSLSSSSSSEYQMPWRPAGKGVGNGPIPPQGPGLNNVRPGRSSFSQAEGEREKEMIRVRMVEQQAKDREAQMMRAKEQGGNPSVMTRSSSMRAGVSNGARKPPPPISIVPQPPMRSQTPAVLPSSMSNRSLVSPSTPSTSHHHQPPPPQQRMRTTSLKAPSTPAPPQPKEKEEEGEGRVLSEGELKRILKKRDVGDDGIWRCLICGDDAGGELEVVRIITEEDEWEKLKSYHLPSHPLLHTSYPSNSLSLCHPCRVGFTSYSIILRPLSSSTARVIALPSPYQAKFRDLHGKEVRWNESETWRAVRPFKWAVGFHRNVGERLAKGYVEAKKNGDLPQRGKTPAPGGQSDHRPKKKVSFAPMPE